MKSNIILRIIKAIVSPFTKIKHCKSSCCEFDCDSLPESRPPSPVDKKKE